jgi:hypothetical protein
MQHPLGHSQLFGAATRRILYGIKLASLAICSLIFVVIAAVLISIIQFQIRIIEAKSQSRSFSLTSLIQSVRMQEELEDSLKTIHEQAAVLVLSEEFESSFAKQMTQFASDICSWPTDKTNIVQCTGQVGGLLMSGMPNRDYFYRVVESFIGTRPSELPTEKKSIVDDAVSHVSLRQEFTQKNGKDLSQVHYACVSVLMILGSVTPDYGEKSSIMNSFSSDYVRAARVRCLTQYGQGVAVMSATGGSTPAAGQLTQASMASKAAEQISGTGITAPNASTSADKKQPLESDISWALVYDLIAYYRFYEKFFKTHTELIVLAPIDISFVFLVIFCGALGAMLRITAEIYNPKLFDKEHAELGHPLIYYFVTGIMCSLIVYILARTAFAGLADSSYVTKSGNLSPFVIAFLAIISGVLCEEAFQQIMLAGRALLSRTGGKRGD